MDKIREDGYATKKHVLSKINELVEGYNKIKKELSKLKKVVFIDAYDTMIEKINNHIKDFHKITK